MVGVRGFEACSTSYGAAPCPPLPSLRVRTGGPHVPGALPRGAAQSSAPRSRRQRTVEVHASVPRSPLSAYRFKPRAPGSAESDWFQAAVRHIVKNVDRTPFMELVDLGGLAPRFTTVPCPDSVVPVPELWRGVAEHMSGDHPDVVILVQAVNPSHSSPARVATAAADEASAWAEAAGEPTSSGDLCTASPRSSGGGGSGGPYSREEARQRVEVACSRLVQSGMAASLLTGKVGDCCEGPSGHGHGQADSSSSSGAAGVAPVRGTLAAAGPLPSPASSSSAVVPFLAAAPRRRAVQVAALRPAAAAAEAAPPPAEQPCDKDTCFYGLVVQSAQQREVSGCYLLKTVRMLSATGCACTHFSLTRVCQGEHLEQQFVNSWLV